VRKLLLLLAGLAWFNQLAGAAWFSRSSYFSPAALAATSDGKTLFVACGTANRVLRFDTARENILDSATMPASPSGMVLSADGKILYVTCAAPESEVCIVDAAKLKITGTISAGHTALSPVLTPDGKTLCVCNQFNNDVSVIDLATRRELRRIAVQREPVAADITKDGRFLLVANHLSTGRADVKFVGAVVSVIDLVAGKVVKELQLPSGSEMLKGLKVSPDGKYAVVTHIFCNYDLPTTKVDFGWMNANALTIIDLSNLEIRYTLLLDEPKRGAANPWGVAWSADSATLAVAHAGTHEVSVIDFPKLLAALPVERKVAYQNFQNNSVLTFVPHYEDEESNDGLPFLVGARERVPLGENDFVPRAIVISGRKIYTANYISDTLSKIDLVTQPPRAKSLALGPKEEMSLVRQGEFYFHNAGICYQGWQSCSSCHPGDGRVDALNWDLANDGLGNPKNTRSLLLADRTPPAMALGVRPDANAAIRAGIKFILFTNQPETVVTAISAYLKSLKPVPSPYLVAGKLPPAARRGKKVFTQAGCINAPVAQLDRAPAF
jgi:YVTN family beta-propeller protein